MLFLAIVVEQVLRCYSGFFYDLLDESSMRSWSSFGRAAVCGKVRHNSKCCPSVDNDLSWLCNSFQADVIDFSAVPACL